MPRTCARLARQLDPDPDHAEHTARLATELFDRTAAMHGLDAHARELLEAAAIVHNVGLFISHSSHHKHSYYVVRNSEQMTGFTDHEIELIAVIARYHRKSRPKDEARRVRRARPRATSGWYACWPACCGSRSGWIAGTPSRCVRCGCSSTTTMVRIEPVGEPGVDLDVEIYAARERSELLAEGLGTKVRINRPEQAADIDSSS